MKKINILFSAVLILLKLNSNGQAIYDWALKFGGTPMGTSADEGRTVKTDNTGNVYVAGSFFGTADFDPGPGTQTITSAGSGDGYIAKYDASGNFLAVYTFTNNLDCKIYSIDIDNAGNIVATGNFQGTVDFDPTAGFYGLSSPSGYDFFVFKLNSNGTFAWAVKIGASGVSDYGYSIDADFNNDILVTGSFLGNTDFNPGAGTNNLVSTTGGDVFVLKLTSAGVFAWAFNIGNGTNSIDCGNAIHSDAVGNVYVGGYFQGICDFDPSVSNFTLSTTGIQNGFVAQYNASGNFIWAKQFDGTGKSDVADFNLHSSGDLYVATTFTGNIDADPGAGVSIISTGSAGDIGIVKINSSGNFAWSYQVGGTGDDSPLSITSDLSGVYFSGYFTGTVDFDPSTVNTQTLTSLGYKDFFISKMDLNGNHLFSYGTGNSGGDEKAYAIATPSTNLVYVAGTFYSTVDFNPNPLVSNTLTSTGGMDAFLLKLKPCTETLSLTPLTTIICSGSSASLTASGSTNFSWSTGATTSVIVVSPTNTSNYVVTASFTTGCVDTKTAQVQVNLCTGVNENKNSENNVLIYPNPNNGTFNILLNKTGVYKIANALGQVVKTIESNKSEENIYVNDLSSGIYYLIGENIISKISVAK